jgi:hypothetical protein
MVRLDGIVVLHIKILDQFNAWGITKSSMKLLATSCADSCERKESSIHTTLGDSKEKWIISINEIHKRENRGIIRKLEKPSTKPMNAQIPYKILLNKIMNWVFFLIFPIYALFYLLVKWFSQLIFMKESWLSLVLEFVEALSRWLSTLSLFKRNKWNTILVHICAWLVG